MCVKIYYLQLSQSKKHSRSFSSENIHYLAEGGLFTVINVGDHRNSWLHQNTIHLHPLRTIYVGKNTGFVQISIILCRIVPYVNFSLQCLGSYCDYYQAVRLQPCWTYFKKPSNGCCWTYFRKPTNGSCWTYFKKPANGLVTSYMMLTEGTQIRFAFISPE